MQMPVLKVAVLGATIMVLEACSQPSPGPYAKFEDMPPDATVTMNEVRAVCIGSVGRGSGTLKHRGISYPCTGAGTTPPTVSAPPSQAPAGGIIAKLDAIVATLDAHAASARATQPDWSTPLGQN
jgi:hypothetical protein